VREDGLEDGMSKHWWAPLTGVAFVVLVIIGGAVQGEPPDVDKAVEPIVAYYTDDADSIRIGTLLIAWGLVAWLFFAGIVRRALRTAEGEGRVLSAVSFAGAVILATGGAIDGTISFALAENADDIEPAGVQALSALWENDFLPFIVGIGTFMLATGLSIVRHGALPKWLGWFAIVLGVLAVTPIGFVAFLGGGLWVIAASVVLTLQERRTADPPAAAPAAPLPPAGA
jgi:hypothetical protein